MPIDADPDEPAPVRGTPAAPDRRPGRGAPLGRDAPAEPKALADTPAGPNAGAGRDTPAEQDTRAGAGGRSGPDSPGPSDDRAPRGESAAAAFRERQLSAHASYREKVAATDQAYAAQEAWAEAVPQLRASWAEHKQRYPERSHALPHTQTDGGWVADGNRRLTPEQNAEATKAHADLQAETKDVIFPAMLRIEASSPDGTLAGIEHRLKGEDRLKEKLADELLAKPEKTVRGALSEVADAVRFTLTYPSERYAEGVLTDVAGLKAEGFELLKLKNLWAGNQYKGINSQWRQPDTGTRIEMQFHTPESLEAKELTHPAYERIRGSEASPAEQRELKAFQRRANALLVTPPGAADIRDFPEKNHG